MQSLVGQFRPNLLNAPVAQSALQPAGGEPAGDGVRRGAFRNVFPNPFHQRERAARPAARRPGDACKVYNVAGQLVETLADGEMEAGEHTLVFAPGSSRRGTYFVHAVAAGSKSARTVVLVR